MYMYVLHIGHGDLCYHGGRAGCVNLLRTIQSRIKPKYHVFGHIHEGNTVHVHINLDRLGHTHITYYFYFVCFSYKFNSETGSLYLKVQYIV